MHNVDSSCPNCQYTHIATSMSQYQYQVSTSTMSICHHVMFYVNQQFIETKRNYQRRTIYSFRGPETKSKFPIFPSSLIPSFILLHLSRNSHHHQNIHRLMSLQSANDIICYISTSTNHIHPCRQNFPSSFKSCSYQTRPVGPVRSCDVENADVEPLNLFQIC